jgi:pSer/pThr/pTyr-binding forkhead associated (FHA) protein
VIPTGLGISRQHARITKQGDKSVTHDLDSTNGTFVDAKTAAASKGISLKDGNVVSVGEISLVFKEMRKGDTPQDGNATN